MASFSSKFIEKVLELLNIFSETPNLQNLNSIFVVIFLVLSNELLRFWAWVLKKAQIRFNIEIFWESLNFYCRFIFYGKFHVQIWCQIGKHFEPVIGPKAQCSDKL